jgi:hypothetical protein
MLTKKIRPWRDVSVAPIVVVPNMVKWGGRERREGGPVVQLLDTTGARAWILLQVAGR